MAPKKISKSTISAPTASKVTATAYSFQLPALNIPQSSLAEGTPIPAPKREPTPPISPPQTPLSRDSPNPLRSHPTSSHSLTRKFSTDATANLNGHTRMSPPKSTNSNTEYSSGTIVPGNTLAKRSHTSGAASPTAPPSKRPHIRKLLSLKSLASLNRSSADVARAPSHHDGPGYSVEIRSQSPVPSTSTTMSTMSRLKRRASGAFWRRESAFGHGLGIVGEENDTHMGGMENIRKHTPPPTLPELDSIGGGLDTVVEVKSGNHTMRRQASGWFGGDTMFDGIGRR